MSLPIVFVHGIRLSGSMWNTLIPCVAGAHRTAAPDLPGHGSRRGERFSMDAAVECVTASIDRVGGRALLVGLSLGGYVSIATAGRYPARVAGLVAMGCTARPTALSANVYRMLGSVAALNPELANRFSAAMLRRTLPPALAEAFLAGGQSCEIIPHVAKALRAEDPLAALAAYPGNVWFINGARDPFRIDEQRFVRAARAAELTVIPGAGHLTTLLDANAVAERLIRCAARCDTTPAQQAGV